jgi:hypothetical protein
VARTAGLEVDLGLQEVALPGLGGIGMAVGVDSSRVSGFSRTGMPPGRAPGDVGALHHAVAGL